MIQDESGEYKLILLVEDSEDWQHMIRRYLREAISSCEVQVVSRWEEAIQLLSEQPWDLIITDVAVDGYGSVQYLCGEAKRLGCRAKIIVYSGYRLDEEEVRSYGADGLYFKACVDPGFEKLMEMVKKLLE